MFEELSEQKAFLEDYRIPQERFAKAMVSWGILSAIANDYLIHYDDFKCIAERFIEKFYGCMDVHASNYRIKDVNHLIEKVIRKNPKRSKDGVCITVENYKQEITDIIGIRLVLLYKRQWKNVHDFIIENYGDSLHEDPFAYVSSGDDLTDYKEKDVRHILSKDGYRSVHYVIKENEYRVEIQVRTLAEEVWGEIDHNIRYPYKINNPILGQYMSLMAALSSSIDNMATFLCTHINRFDDSQCGKTENEVYNEILSEIEKIEGNKEIKDRLRTIIMNTDEYQKIIDPLSLIDIISKE